MATSVTSIDASASLMEAAEMMRHANVGVLPVVGPDGKVEGVITDRDLVVRAMARGADARTTRVGECQTRDLVCARSDWSLAEAMERMAECQAGRLPVVVPALLSQEGSADGQAPQPRHVRHASSGRAP